MRANSRVLKVCILAFLLGGCAVGDEYRRPAQEIPAHYRHTLASEPAAVALRWWEQFNDPVLTGLVGDALERNADLRIATARLREYQAIYVGTSASAYPQLTLPGTYTRSQQGSTPVQKVYQAGLSLSWELDFWGRIQRLSEAAQADALGQAQARQAVVLSLVGAVATSYIQLRELDAQLEIARRTQADRQKAVRIAQARLEAGVGSEMELKQAGTENESTVFAVQQLEQAVAQKENEISLLLGRNPGPVARGRALRELAVPGVPAGLPSDLLERRPDILQAEQALVAANARVGAARASLFPTISLTSLYGGVSSSLSGLFKGPGRYWSFAPGVSQPLFDGGLLRSQVEATQAQREQALASYDKAIQSAFRECEDALIGVAQTREQQATQARLVGEVQRYAYLARRRYEDGVTSALEVLDSQRQLYAAEQGLVQSQSATLVAMVNLYKALGGDWLGQPPAEGASAANTVDNRDRK